MDGLGIHPLTYVWCLSQTPPGDHARLSCSRPWRQKAKRVRPNIGVCECVLAPNLHMVPFFIKQVAELLLRPH